MKRFQIVVVVLLLLAACSRNQPEQAAPSETSKGLAEPVAVAAPATQDRGAPNPSPASQTRLVIQTANLTVRVNNVQSAEHALRATVKSLGGYIASSETTGQAENASTTIVLRVPAKHFESLLEDVGKNAKEVLSRSLTGQDVTEEFVDLKAQQKNLEATNARLLGFLRQATTVKEALEVNAALSDIQGKLEQIKGRQQYLQQNAALASITVAFLPLAARVAQSGWYPMAVLEQAFAGLLGFLQQVANTVLVLLVWSPTWLLGLWLLRVAWLRLRPRLQKI